MAELSMNQLEEAVVGIVQAGLEAAVKFDPSLTKAEADDVIEAVNLQLESGTFVENFTSEVDYEAGLNTLTVLCSKIPDSLIGHAFGQQEDARQFDPRMRRVLTQLIIGQTLSVGGDSWARAAAVYLCLLSLPGALSYQLFRPSVLSLILTKMGYTQEKGVVLDVEQEKMSPIVEELVDLVQSGPVRSRIMDSGIYLMKQTVEALIGGGIVCPELQPKVVGALKLLCTQKQSRRKSLDDIVGDEIDALLKGSKKKDKMEQDDDDDEEEEEEEEEDDDDDDEYDDVKSKKKRKASKKAKKTKGTASHDEEEQSPIRSHLLQLLVGVFKSQKPNTNEFAFAAVILKGFDSATVLTLLEHLCFEVSTKAEGRNITSENCAQIIKAVEVPFETIHRFCQFLSKLSQSKEEAQRSFAAQVAGILSVAEGVESMNEDLFQGLNELLLARAEDRSATVRTSALKALGELIDATFLHERMESDVAREMVETTLEALRKRISDKKPTVRRTAVKSMQLFLCNEFVRRMRGESAVVNKDFAALCERARDVSPLIRNSVLQTVQKYLELEEDEQVYQLWISTVLPLVYDPTQSVQKAARDAVRSSILTKLLHFHQIGKRKNTTVQDLDLRVFKLLVMLQQEDVLCLRKAFYDQLIIDKAGNFTVQDVIKALTFAISTDKLNKEDHKYVRHGAWMFLDTLLGGSNPLTNKNKATDEIAKIQQQAQKALDVNTMIAAFDEADGEEDELIQHKLLNVMISISDRIPAKEATRMAGVLFTSIEQMTLPTDDIKLSLTLVASLCVSKAPTMEEGKAIVQTFGSQLMEKCREALKELYKQVASSAGVMPFSLELTEKATRVLFLVGELAILGLDPDDKNSALIPLDEEVITLTMGILASDQYDNNQQVRAHAFVATGKICLRDERIAKDMIRMFVRELEQNHANDTIRSNVIVILGDLCRRYTNIVDPHLDSISACLADPSPKVRKNGLILLTGLIQEDYIKWRGLLFARYLMCAVDPNQEIRNLVRYALKEVFPEKNPGLFHGHFVETIFAFNGVVTSKFQIGRYFQKGEEMGKLLEQRHRYCQRVTSPTPQSHKLRMQLYLLMLDHMSATHRLEVTNKICRDILGEILDEHLTMRGAMYQVLCDSFTVLCTPNIKVKLGTGTAAANEDEEEMMNKSQTVQMKMQEAKNKVLSKLETKNLTDNIIPMVISFYRMLQRDRSPILRYVCNYLQTLMKDFKEEMSQVLGADKLLEQEIQYDLAQARKEVEKQETFKHTPNAKAKTPTNETQTKKKKSSSRRKSTVTFEPSVKDTAPRTSNGVLRTPIPTSTKKRRHSVSIQDDLQQLQDNPAPKLSTHKRFKPDQENTENANIVTLKSTNLLFTGSKSATKSSHRKWSIEPSAKHHANDNDTARDLTEQLLAIK